MKVAKISDIKDLADGSVIGEMTVQVKAVFAAKTGEGKFGTWRVQPAIIKDGTGEVRASFWTNEDINDLRGQTVTIKSQATNKGLSGISVKFSKHSGENEISISDKAAINDSTKGALDQYVDAKKVNTQLAQSKGSVTDAKRLIFQRAQLYVECANAAKWVAEQTGISTTEEIQAIRSTLFISADKANLSNCFPVEQVKAGSQKVDVDEIPMKNSDADDELGW
jgi:hypothetical protein